MAASLFNDCLRNPDPVTMRESFYSLLDRPSDMRPALFRMIVLVLLPAIVLLAAVLVIVLRRESLVLSRGQMLRMLAEAEHLSDVDDDSGAEQLIRQVLDADTHNLRARLLLGEVLWKRKDPAAFDHWNSIPESEPGFGSTARYLEGTALLDQGDAGGAEQKLLRALQLGDSNVPAATALLRLNCLLRRPAEIHRMLSLIAQVRELTVREQAIAVLAEHSVYSVKESLKIVEHHLSVNPEDELSRLAKVEYLRESGLFEDALQELVLLRDSPQAQLLRLLIFLDTGDAQAAGSLFQTVSSEALQDRRVRVAIAGFCVRHGEFQLAIEILAGIREASRLDAAFYHTLGLALDGDGQKQQAAECFAAAMLASRIEADAFRLIEGHSDRNLLAQTMAGISRNAFLLGHELQGEAWKIQAIRMGLPSEFLSPVASVVASANESPVLSSAAELSQKLRQAFENAAAPGLQHSSSEAISPIRFTDVAEQSGINFAFDNGATGRKLIVESIGGGVAVLDFDLDGWPDLFFPQGGSLEGNAGKSGHDQLFRNLGNGRFEDVSVLAGIVSTDYHLGCCAVDFDNDGDADIVAAGLYENLLYVNCGDGTFKMQRFRDDRKQLSASVAAADFNGDGNLDLWFANYLEQWDRTCLDSEGQFRMCLPTVYPPAADQLLLNAGDGGFRTAEHSSAGISPAPTLGIVAVDFNGDHRSDVYCANDFAPNQLFINESTDQRPAFREQAFSAGCAVSEYGRAEAGMGIAVADFDRNQRPDLFVTNFYAESNRLYLQSDTGFFIDSSSVWRIPGTSLPLLGFGVQAADFDLDGFEDLCIANGHIDDLSSTGAPWKMPAQVLRNIDGRQFADVSASAGDYFEGHWLGRGLATIDFDRDGLLDVVIVHHDRSVALLKNETETRRGLTIRLIGTMSNRMAAGASVTVRHGDIHLCRWTRAGDGFMASNEQSMHFGGLQDVADVQVTVTWPTGIVDVLPYVPTASDIVLIEGRSATARIVSW